MQTYEYDGPVMEFGICISNRWYGRTRAVSEQKARSNLAYRFKSENNRIASSKITLPGRLIML